MSFQKLLSDLHPNNIRYLFYLVTPNETIYERMEDVPNYTDITSLWMILFILLEFFFLDDRKYAFSDTVTSINAGIFSLLVKFGGRYLSAAMYKSFYDRLHIIDLPPDATSTWLISFFAQDLMYYLGHRAIHEAGVFWAFHQMHHSSEYYNLSTALRQGAIQDFGMAIFDLLQSFFVPPNVFIVHRYLNILYQFWLHTTLVPYLGPLEYFLNTPSSHRVHHGRNPYCIDRNYGGTLIIWDRLFGTYIAEKDSEEIAYGLVTPVSSFDQMWCQFFEFKALGYDKGQMKDEKGEEIFPGTENKVLAALMPPGYFPGVKTKQFFLWKCMEDNTEGIPDIKGPVEPYLPSLSLGCRIYIFIQMVVIVFASLHFNLVRNHLPWSEFLLHVVYIVGSMQAFGYYFDHRPFAKVFDTVRLLLMTLFSYFVYNETTLAVFSIASIVALVIFPIEATKTKAKTQ